MKIFQVADSLYQKQINCLGCKDPAAKVDLSYNKRGLFVLTKLWQLII